MEKCTLGEFAWASRASAEGVDGVEDAFNDQGIAVAGNFHKIFPSVRFWVRPSGDDDFIQSLCVLA